MKEFKSWKDIHDWAWERGFELMANRMRLNNSCWNSSGEFGRSQVAICDAMRFCETEQDRYDMAQHIEDSLKNDDLLQCVKGKGENL